MLCATQFITVDKPNDKKEPLKIPSREREKKIIYWKKTTMKRREDYLINNQTSNAKNSNKR